MSRETTSVIEAGLLALFALAERMPSEDITLAAIAEEAECPLADFRGVATVSTLIEAIDPYFDTAMSAEDVDKEDTPRERLFDVVMRRFEAMEPHRDGMVALMLWRQRVPSLAIKTLAGRRKTASWALACAGLDAGGDGEQLAKTAGLAWAIRKAERAWRKDENGDFARTMSTLDRELVDLEARLKRLGRLFGRGSPARSRDTGDRFTDTPPPSENDAS